MLLEKRRKQRHNGSWLQISSRFQILAVIGALVIVLCISYILFLLHASRNLSSLNSSIPKEDDAPQQPDKLIPEAIQMAKKLLHIRHDSESPHLRVKFAEPGKKYDPNSDLSPPEWTRIREKVASYRDGSRFLVGWPTIPVAYKGSDSRALDAIKFLSSAGFSVDLIFWRDFAKEAGDSTWDDTPDRNRLIEAGVNQILGPFDETKLSDSHQFVSSYYGFLFWLWPDGPYLECVHDFVNHIKKMNGSTRLIAAVDDRGVAVRNLFASCNNSSRTVEETQQFLLLNKRHPDLIGSDAESPVEVEVSNSSVPSEEEYNYIRSPTYLLHMEMYLYAMADLTLGINAHIVDYLAKMVPGTPSHQLGYVSPILPDTSSPSLPFKKRQGYLFFGYNNPANYNAIDWFQREVLPHVDTNHKLHIAGRVCAYPCACQQNPQLSSKSHHPNVVCHGALTSKELETLIQSVRVAINPVLEPSGVATKTSRSMSHGTPVVVTKLDGTFDEGRTTPGAKRCPKGDVLCFAHSLNSLLLNEEEWNQASREAKTFVSKSFGGGKYMREWLEILDRIEHKSVEILMDGDAQLDGEAMEAQNWHIINTLTSQPDFRVRVMGKLEPPISGVIRVDPPSIVPERLPDDKNGGMWPRHKSYKSPFETGYQANLIIRQRWPPSFDPVPLKYCGVGCRVAQLLPWEFGSLPKSWFKQISNNVDWLWAPSDYNRRMFDASGLDRTRSAVLSAGLDCERLVSLVDEKTTTRRLKHDPVVFIYSGEFLPRKGVDIILEEWESLFCEENSTETLGVAAPNMKLILHTTHELGYSPKEIRDMERIVEKCGNIEWKRNQYLGRDHHLALLQNGDIYISPFRSESFGLTVAEALVLGLSVITSVGGTAVDDYLSEWHSTMDAELLQKDYAVQARREECRHYPCQGKKMCMFSPCKDMGERKGRRCKCETLVEEPTWFEVDRGDLRAQMMTAFQDTIARRKLRIDEPEDLFSKPVQTNNNKGNMSFCWSELQAQYRESIVSFIKSPRNRQVQEYIIIHPDDVYKEQRYFWHFSFCAIAAGIFLLLLCMLLREYLCWRQLYHTFTSTQVVFAPKRMMRPHEHEL